STRHIGYGDRQALNRDAKSRIADRAARLIPDDSALILNIGTTTEAVARALRDHRNLMVVTNNMNVANILTENPSTEVIVAGGRLRRSDGALVGDEAAATFERFKVDFAVIGASALDTSGDLLDFDAAEVRVAQTILRQSRARLLVADHTKFARRAPMRIANLADLDIFITDAAPPESVQTLCETAGTRILTP
ncbi:MAG: DeoR/GlpR family DNA-binding transcription regulator, partial [Pseudomonadota bacterium]